MLFRSRQPQAEPWSGHENYLPNAHTPINTDATIAIIDPTTGTTSTKVKDTRAQAELKAAQNDTMKKKCAEKTPEIGRASCRERVKISVVAVTIKKKTKKKQKKNTIHQVNPETAIHTRET